MDPALPRDHDYACPMTPSTSRPPSSAIRPRVASLALSSFLVTVPWDFLEPPLSLTPPVPRQSNMNSMGVTASRSSQLRGSLLGLSGPHLFPAGGQAGQAREYAWYMLASALVWSSLP